MGKGGASDFVAIARERGNETVSPANGAEPGGPNKETPRREVGDRHPIYVHKTEEEHDFHESLYNRKGGI